MAAYNTYGWWYGGSLRWREEFHGDLDSSDWKIGGWGLRKGGNVRNQNGMLTLNTGERGTVKAMLDRPGRRYGRWEMRFRSRRYSYGHHNYQVITELVARSDPYKFCGAKNVALEAYRLGRDKMTLYARSRPEHIVRHKVGLKVRNDEWHTAAVEVTPERISWFIDAHVVATETRPEAFDTTWYTVQFKLKAKPGKRMNRSRMQMDWLRSWTLRTPEQRTDEIEAAPQPTAGIYWRACDRDGNQIR